MDKMEIQERKSFLTQAEAYLDIAICRVWLLQRRQDEARDILNEMDDILVNLSRIYACMGDICMKEGMKDSAETYYRKFMFLNPGVPLSKDFTERLNGIEELHTTDAEGRAEGEVQIPPDFQTVTLAELYIRQGHLRPAEELLEKIIGQDPQNEKAAGLLQDVRERLLEGASVQQYAGVLAELSRWLDNVGRLRAHAA